MPDLSLIELVLLAAMTLVGVIAGWMLRAGRCTREKQAINAGWTDQIAAQKSEHHRLADQNNGQDGGAVAVQDAGLRRLHGRASVAL